MRTLEFYISSAPKFNPGHPLFKTLFCNMRKFYIVLRQKTTGLINLKKCYLGVR